MKPTDEQKREFWEGCGFKHRDGHDEYVYGWYRHGLLIAQRLPIDLNNLFKYAVPNIPNFDRISLEPCGKEGAWFATVYQRVFPSPETYIEHEGKDPALALFWAIWEVVNTGNFN